MTEDTAIIRADGKIAGAIVGDAYVPAIGPTDFRRSPPAMVIERGPAEEAARRGAKYIGHRGERWFIVLLELALRAGERLGPKGEKLAIPVRLCGRTRDEALGLANLEAQMEIPLDEKRTR